MPTTMKLIAKNVLGSAASSVAFSDLPGTYTDLYIVLSSRHSNTNGFTSPTFIRFNGSSSGYSNRVLSASYSNGTVQSYGDLYNVTSASWVDDSPDSGLTANTFSNTEIYVPNYAGSTNKSFSVTNVSEQNGNTTDTWRVAAAACLWSNTAAITSVTFYAGNIGVRNFVSGSSFYLYGITKA